MELLSELVLTDIDSAMLAQVRALVERQQAQLAAQDFKIKALTLELAHYRRIRFGKASEVLQGEQRLLFDETLDTDLAEIEGEMKGTGAIEAAPQVHWTQHTATGAAAHRSSP